MLAGMHRSFKVLALMGVILGLALFGLRSAPIATAAPAKVPSPNEYATLVLNDPWDMDTKGDIPQPYQGVTNVSASNSIWSATITSAGVQNGVGLWFLAPGFKGGMPIGKEGKSFMHDNQIDTSKYHYLSFRMNYTGQNSPIVAIFGTDGWDDFAGDAAANYAAVGWITINPGWNNYMADLSSLNYLQGRNWTNLVNKKLTGLRFLMVNGQQGANLQFNWIRLTDARYSFNDTLNNPTRLQFTAPSYTSGQDYATATRGSAWDMNSTADVYTTPPPFDPSIDLTNFSFVGGIANFQNTSSQSKLYFHGPENVPIDSSQYRYLTYRFWIEGTWDLSSVGGWVGRAIWFGPGGYGTDDAVTQDWYFREDWNTYTIDLVTAPLEPEHVNHSTWTSVQPRILRLTPNEGTLQQTMHLDYARLTARDTADTLYTIRWNTINPDGNSVAITLYYDTDQDPTNGRTLIGAVSGNPGSYNWNTSGLPNGQAFYVSGDVNDGYNTTTWYSETPLVIVHLGSIKTYLPLILR